MAFFLNVSRAKAPAILLCVCEERGGRDGEKSG